MATYLGIDCGTQSTKVLVYDPSKKKTVARGQAPHALIQDNKGTREQKAEWWVKALKKALSAVPKSIRSTIAAVGVSGQQHGFVPVDAEGAVLYNVKLWNDTSTAAECEEITARYGSPEKLLAEVGNLIVPGYTAPKVLWLKKNHPDLYKRMKTILLPHDYLNFYLTGQKTMEYGDASGTGYLNIRTRKWDRGILRAADPERDLSSCLPRLSETSEPAGFVTEKAAKEFGIPAGALVACGGGDNMMGAIGTGTNADGSLTVSLGTSGTIYGYSSKPIIDPEGNLAAFCSSTGGWLPLLCTMNCTVATELTRALWSADVAALERFASKAKPGSSGVIMLPFFNGERTPNLPAGKGCIMGLTPVNYTRENIFRAAMESGIYGLKLGLETFEKLGCKPREIKLIGGGSKSKLWRQIAADIFDLPVVCPQEEEAAALGGALQAYWSDERKEGRKADLNEILRGHVAFSQEKRHKPAPANVKIYNEAYALYKKYVGAVSPIFKQTVAEISEERSNGVRRAAAGRT